MKKELILLDANNWFDKQSRAVVVPVCRVFSKNILKNSFKIKKGVLKGHPVIIN
jgi:hypothetical protein